jgi:nitrogen fixation NifU-like protein
MLKFDKNMLYREVISEHYKNPLNSKIVNGLEIFRSKNPLCGDDVSLQVEFDLEGKIKDIFHTSIGCSISVSSVSILTSVLKGKTLSEGIYIVENFINMATGNDFDKKIDFKDGVVFENIKNYPARQSCAIVGWKLVLKALKSRLEGDENATKR